MLTDTKVRNARPRPKPYKLADGNRLFLLVAPSGGKLWRWNYVYDGRNKTMAFGAYRHMTSSWLKPSRKGLSVAQPADVDNVGSGQRLRFF